MATIETKAMALSNRVKDRRVKTSLIPPKGIKDDTLFIKKRFAALHRQIKLLTLRETTHLHVGKSTPTPYTLQITLSVSSKGSSLTIHASINQNSGLIRYIADVEWPDDGITRFSFQEGGNLDIFLRRLSVDVHTYLKEDLEKETLFHQNLINLITPLLDWNAM